MDMELNQIFKFLFFISLPKLSENFYRIGEAVKEITTSTGRRKLIKKDYDKFYT